VIVTTLTASHLWCWSSCSAYLRSETDDLREWNARRFEALCCDWPTPVDIGNQPYLHRALPSTEQCQADSSSL